VQRGAYVKKPTSTGVIIAVYRSKTVETNPMKLANGD
jgi:hypothetical protein